MTSMQKKFIKWNEMWPASAYLAREKIFFDLYTIQFMRWEQVFVKILK